MQALSAVLRLPNENLKGWSEGPKEKGLLQGSAPELSPSSPGWSDLSPPEIPERTVPASLF